MKDGMPLVEYALIIILVAVVVIVIFALLGDSIGVFIREVLTTSTLP